LVHVKRLVGREGAEWGSRIEWTRHAAAIRRIVSVNGRLIGLVDVAEPEKLVPRGSHIPDLHHGVLQDLPLHIKVVVVDVWCAQLGIDAGGIRGVTCEGGRVKYRNAWGQHTRREREEYRIAANSVVRRPGIERIEEDLSRKEVLGKDVVENPGAATNNSLASAAHVPGNADSRAEVVQITVVQLPLLHQTGAWIVNAEAVLGLVDYAEILPPQAEVESDLGRSPDAVLHIERM